MDPRIKQLVGNVTGEQLRLVEVFLCNGLGLFVPVLGQCGYAIQRDHTHPSWMVLVAAAEVPLVGISVEPSPPGYNLRILAPQVPHQERPSAEPNRYYALMIRPDWFQRAASELGIDTSQFAWQPYPASDRLLYLIRDFMREHDLRSSTSILDAIASLMIHELLRCTRPEPQRLASVVPHASLRLVVEAMEHRCQENWTLAELARLAGMSISTFQRAFRSTLDCSPMTYLNQIRTRRAQHLLRSGSSVSKAAEATGFASVSHFSEAFRRVTKLTPLQYRRQHLATL